MLSRSIYISILIMGMLFLSSCYPIFVNPLPFDSSSSIDESLLGVWVVLEDGVLKDQLCIKPRQDGWVNVVYIYDINKNYRETLSLVSFDGYVSKTDAGNFINLKCQIKKDKETFIIGRYSFDDSGAVICEFPSLEKMEALVKSKKLKGEIVNENLLSGKLTRTVSITSEPNEITHVFNELDDNNIYENNKMYRFRFVRPQF